MLATIRRGHWDVSGGLLGVFGVLVLALGYRALSHPPLDLEVYLLCGSIAWSGGDDLYAAASLSSLGLPFTCPPFAAVTFGWCRSPGSARINSARADEPVDSLHPVHKTWQFVRADPVDPRGRGWRPLRRRVRLRRMAAPPSSGPTAVSPSSSR